MEKHNGKADGKQTLAGSLQYFSIQLASVQLTSQTGSQLPKGKFPVWNVCTITFYIFVKIKS